MSPITCDIRLGVVAFFLLCLLPLFEGFLAVRLPPLHRLMLSMHRMYMFPCPKLPFPSSAHSRTIRQVPDTQEVFVYPDCSISIITEILEKVEPIKFDDAIR